MSSRNTLSDTHSDTASYLHPLEKEQVPINKNEISELKEKVDTVKLIIQVMAEKIIILEAEMNTVKRAERYEEVIQEIKSKEEDTKRETVPLQTSDMEKKTLSVPAHSFQSRAPTAYLSRVI